MMEKSRLLSALDSFSGSEQFFRHSLNRKLLYTEGVQFLAEQADAYWLIDLIASWQIQPQVRQEEFQVWHLRVLPPNGVFRVPTATKEITVSPRQHKALAWMTDGNTELAIVHQKIQYTDFPLEEIKLWLERSGENWVLMLPGER